jgi:antitoxin PrlF
VRGIRLLSSFRQRASGQTWAVVPCNTCRHQGITGLQVAVTVTRKGQVTIPNLTKPVRDRLGIIPGSKVDFEVAEDGRAYLRRLGKTAVKPSRFEARAHERAADFFIGAHAAVPRFSLLTRELRRDRAYFPGVELIAPDEPER